MGKLDFFVKGNRFICFVLITVYVYFSELMDPSEILKVRFHIGGQLIHINSKHKRSHTTFILKRGASRARIQQLNYKQVSGSNNI